MTRSGRNRRRRTNFSAPLVPEALEGRRHLSTYTVNTLSDAADAGAGLLTLRQAIADVNANAGPNTINFAPSLFSGSGQKTLTLTQGQLALTQVNGLTTIVGPGAGALAISGNHASRVLVVAASATVTLSGATFTQGLATDNSGGGAILSAGTLTLNACEVVGNVSQSIGGGISSSGGPLTVSNSTIANNTAQPASPNQGNGLIAGGGIFTAASAQITSSTFSNNLAYGFDVQNDLENGDAASGGGVYGASTLNLQGDAFTGNEAHGGYGFVADGGASAGGAIYAGGTLTASALTVAGNVSLSGSSEYENPGDAMGAGIAAFGSASVSQSTFSGNVVAGASNAAYSPYAPGDAVGGAIFANGGTTLIVSGSVLSGNSAFVPGDSEPGAKFADYAAGGAIAGDAVTLSQSTLSGNSARTDNGTAYSSYTGGPGGDARGGAVAADGTLSVTLCSITANKADAGNGYKYAADGGTALGAGIYGAANISISHSTVAGNSAVGGNAGAAHAGAYNKAAGVAGAALGGGIYDQGDLHLLQTTVSGNTALAGNGGKGAAGIPINQGTAGGEAAGGIDVASSVTLVDSTISGNSATGGAGGNGFGYMAASNNYAGAGGNGGAASGAILSHGGIQLYDSTISLNAAIGGAGGAGGAAGPMTGASGAPGVAAGGLLTIGSGKILLDNTIVSNDHVGSAVNDIVGTANAASRNNLIGVGGALTNGVNGNQVGVTNPRLSPLGNYGGPTQTMLPLANSPAINAGSNAAVPSGVYNDQRGLPRIFNKIVDIGADEFSTITVTGSVYNDRNGDGTRQSGEPGLANWQVYVDVGNVGYYVNGDPLATTSAGGTYSLTFPVTSTSNLIVREVRQNNWRRTQPAGLYPLGYYIISPTTPTDGNLNFGDSATGLIQGFVYHDTNGNGVQNPGEPGLGGWTVQLDQQVNGAWKDNVMSAVTDASGNYDFVVMPGTYRVREVPRSGLKPTTPASGSYTLTVATGATLSGENLGNR